MEQKRRCILGMVVLVIISVALATSTGYFYMNYTRSQSDYQILSDNYNILNELLSGNKTLLQATMAERDKLKSWLDGNITGYTSQIQGLNSQISSLNAQVTGYTSQIQGLNSQISSLNAKIASLQSQVDKFQRAKSLMQELMSTSELPDTIKILDALNKVTSILQGLSGIPQVSIAAGQAISILQGLSDVTQVPSALNKIISILQPLSGIPQVSIAAGQITSILQGLSTIDFIKLSAAQPRIIGILLELNSVLQ